MRHAPIAALGTWLLLQSALALASGTHDHSHSQDLAAAYGGVVGQVGPHRMELVHDARHGVLTLYAPPIASVDLVATVLPDDDSGWEQPFEIALRPLPFATDAAGRTSRFVGAHDGLARIDRFDVRVVLADGSAAAPFAFDGAASAQRGYICPMRCDRDRIFAENGNCPVCGMRLKRVEEAHGDHDPRHGGLMFMAPDQWHHLEGVIVDGQFRLYLYNDFVEPIDAAPFVDRARLILGEQSLEFTLSPEGDCLVAPISGSVDSGIAPSVELSFPGRASADAFDFAFPTP